jgi:hypothetical protein
MPPLPTHSPHPSTSFPPQSFYPCPKFDKSLLKLRHHLCPCDQEKANIGGIVKHAYAAAKKAAAAEAAPAAAAGQAAASSTSKSA